MIKKTALFSLLSVTILCACQPEKEVITPDEIQIAFYNVENLFDTDDDPNTFDEEFTPNGRNKWTDERYEKKQQMLVEVLTEMGLGRPPAIVGMCEVENKQVLEDMLKEDIFSDFDYGIVHRETTDGRGIDQALIYDKSIFTPGKVEQFGLFFPEEPEYKSRELLLIKGEISQEEIYIILNHWPSRRGGRRESESRRIVAATKAREIVNDLLKEDPKAQILLMGDFNDEPSNKSISETLEAEKKISDVDAGELFNPMSRLEERGEGSYRFRKFWDMLDQIIISEELINGDGYAYVKESSTIFSKPWMIQTGDFAGFPFRTYAGQKYLGGYSDHFPVYIKLELKK